MLAEVALPIFIFITNPTAADASLGYPTPVYEKYIAPGKKAPVAYASEKECLEALPYIQVQTRGLAHRGGMVMPNVQQTVYARAASMRCLTADAKPLPKLKANLDPGTRWRIGSMDPQGFFKSQNLDLRQFLTQDECEKGLDQLINTYGEVMQERYRHQWAVREAMTKMSDAYKCISVDPSVKVQVLPVTIVPNLSKYTEHYGRK